MLRRDATIIAELHRFSRPFYFADSCWHFTLPDLFAFLLARYQDRTPSIVQADIDYTSFRRMLYGEPTNTELRRRGGIVEVAHVHKNHAFTVYKLKAIGAQDGLALSSPEL